MPVAVLLVDLLTIYSWIIIARVLLSWVVTDPRNPIVAVLDRVTEPLLLPMRRIVPPATFGGLDLSPVLALVLISIARWALLSTLS